jgi:hypothetical protein
MALVTALMAVGELRSGSWFHLAMALGLFVLVTGAAIKMYRQPGSGDHDPEGSVTDDALIRPPVFVVEGGDVSAHESLQDAMAALEGVDVEDGLYSVYDADGRRIALKGVGVKRSRFIVDVGVVQVASIEAEPTGADELRKSLLGFGRHCGWEVDDETPLAELVELARRTLGLRARADSRGLDWHSFRNKSSPPHFCLTRFPTPRSARFHVARAVCVQPTTLSVYAITPPGEPCALRR